MLDVWNKECVEIKLGNHHKIIKMLKLLLQKLLDLNSWSYHSISLNDGNSGISIHDIHISFTSCKFSVV